MDTGGSWWDDEQNDDGKIRHGKANESEHIR